jgi:Ca-activated chloride channel family protein
MRWVRGLLIALAVAAVAAAYATSRDEGGTQPATTVAAQPETPPATPESTPAAADAPTGDTAQAGVPIRLLYAYSSNLEEMMATLLPAFNAARVEVRGRPVQVRGHAAASGDVQARIVAGRLKPHAWSPASSLWGRLLNYDADRAYVRDENASLASSPVVIAMWEPLARALGWPTRPIGFADILRLATTDSNWAAYGKPTFGRFKLGHTNPDFSTSGLSFVAAQYYTAAGKREGLTVEDVRNPAIRAKVRAIEQAIVHYGDTGSFFSEQLAKHGPGYASAVAMEETTLIEFNQARPRGAMKLVAVYPAEGTYMSDNPYLVLDAPWSTAAQREAAEALGAWLQKRATPKLVARFRYRPGDPAKRPLSPVARANGADPAQPRRLLQLPEPTVLARIKQAWHADRKPANVLLVVDVSGSMNDTGKLDQARLGLQTFLRQLSPRDRVGLMTFAGHPQTIVPIAEFARNRDLLRLRVRELVADGDTALHDATLRGWLTVDALEDDERINAVVVLSDGADTASGNPLGAVLGRLRQRSNGEGRPIRIFTIAYGTDAVTGVLQRIAAASGGNAYSGDPETIREVYLQISSYF